MDGIAKTNDDGAQIGKNGHAFSRAYVLGDATLTGEGGAWPPIAQALYSWFHSVADWAAALASQWPAVPAIPGVRQGPPQAAEDLRHDAAGMRAACERSGGPAPLWAQPPPGGWNPRLSDAVTDLIRAEVEMIEPEWTTLAQKWGHRPPPPVRRVVGGPRGYMAPWTTDDRDVRDGHRRRLGDHRQQLRREALNAMKTGIRLRQALAQLGLCPDCAAELSWSNPEAIDGGHVCSAYHAGRCPVAKAQKAGPDEAQIAQLADRAGAARAAAFEARRDRDRLMVAAGGLEPVAEAPLDDRDFHAPATPYPGGVETVPEATLIRNSESAAHYEADVLVYQGHANDLRTLPLDAAMVAIHGGGRGGRVLDPADLAEAAAARLRGTRRSGHPLDTMI